MICGNILRGGLLLQGLLHAKPVKQVMEIPAIEWVVFTMVEVRIAGAIRTAKMLYSYSQLRIQFICKIAFDSFGGSDWNRYH